MASQYTIFNFRNLNAKYLDNQSSIMAHEDVLVSQYGEYILNTIRVRKEVIQGMYASQNREYIRGVLTGSKVLMTLSLVEQTRYRSRNYNRTFIKQNYVARAYHTVNIRVSIDHSSDGSCAIQASVEGVLDIYNRPGLQRVIISYTPKYYSELAAHVSSVETYR